MESDKLPGKEEYYRYLDELRDSGVTNMFGASSYLEKTFSLSRTNAINILSLWMKNYPLDYDELEFGGELL